jgi:hypothetical protein
VDFIQPKTERSEMTDLMTEEVEVVQDWELKATDRCDSCNAEALVQVTGLDGLLMFCGHHYNKIMDNAEGYKKMMSFAITILDERQKLVKE